MRGLWERNGLYNTQIRASGRKVRLRLEHAETVPQAIGAMQAHKKQDGGREQGVWLAVEKGRQARAKRKGKRAPKCWITLMKKMGNFGGKLKAERLGALEVRSAHSAQNWRQAKTAPGRELGLGAGRSPLKVSQLNSLRDAFREVPHPLHNKEDTVCVILEKGGDYLIGTKENTSKRLVSATQALQGTPFLT